MPISWYTSVAEYQEQESNLYHTWRWMQPIPPCIHLQHKTLHRTSGYWGGSPILLLSSSTFPSHSTSLTYSNCLPTQFSKLNGCQPWSSLTLSQTSFLHMLAQSSCFCNIQTQTTAFSSSLQRPLHSSGRCPRHPIQYSATLRSRVCMERISGQQSSLIKSSLSCSTGMLFTDCDHGKSITRVYLATSFGGPWRANKHPTATSTSRIQAF